MFQLLLYQNYQAMDFPNKIIEIAANNEEKFIIELLDSSYQGAKRLFALAYNNTESSNQVSIDSFRKYFLPRVKI